jgi:hypothetical protein
MRYVYRLSTVVMVMFSSLSHAGNVYLALVGSWLTRVKDDKGNRVPVLLEIRQTGEYS